MPLRQMLTLLLLCCILPVQAQVYTWVDEKGQKHFGNQPPASQPKAQEVKIHQGYSSDGQKPAVVPTEPTETTAQTSSTPAQGATSQREMCSEAIRWTGIDIPNLKDIARERKQDGKITSAQYDQSVKALDAAKNAITMQSCMASTGKDRERFECLSGGAGIMVCSGALQDALNKL